MNLELLDKLIELIKSNPERRAFYIDSKDCRCAVGHAISLTPNGNDILKSIESFGQQCVGILNLSEVVNHLNSAFETINNFWFNLQQFNDDYGKDVVVEFLKQTKAGSLKEDCNYNSVRFSVIHASRKNTDV